MSARRRPSGPRCVECRKPILPGEQTHDVRGMAGLLMSQMHREVTNRWHLACWDEVSRWAAESRARAEEQRLADLRAMAEEIGMSPARLSEIAASVGAPDPYAAH